MTTENSDISNETIDVSEGTGLTALANLGNTCFINSTIQCLVHDETFNKFLNKGTFKGHLTKKSETLIFLEYDKLRKLMWSDDCTISPGGFISSVQKVAQIKDRSIFTGYAQNDLTEFLIFMIDCFNTAISREVDMEITGNITTDTDAIAKKCYNMLKDMYTKEYSEILEYFYGIHVSTITDVSDKVLTIRPEPFLMLDLALPEKSNNPITLIDCLEEYTKGEILEGDNSYELENNEKITAKKQIKFWKFPETLIITLKRFSNGIQKNEEFVKFPLNDLDLSSYTIGYNKKDNNYELFGVCNHYGGILGGHYTADVKNRDGCWYNFNDDKINKITNEDDLISKNAYCFFYRKKI
jgi:ubiquitin carboxyl-terminal hydrolase 8